MAINGQKPGERAVVVDDVQGLVAAVLADRGVDGVAGLVEGNVAGADRAPCLALSMLCWSAAMLAASNGMAISGQFRGRLWAVFHGRGQSCCAMALQDLVR